MFISIIQINNIIIEDKTFLHKKHENHTKGKYHLKIIIYSKELMSKNKIDSEIYVNKYLKQGSGIISSISFSDGIVEIPEEVNKINIGDKFDLYLFSELFS